MKIGINLAGIPAQAVAQIQAELPARATMASMALKNASLDVLGGKGGGKRSGRTRRAPSGASYTASAPGQPPAVRTGTLRLSWRPVTFGQYNPGLEGGTPYAGYLEEGTSKMAARPFVDKIVETAEPQVLAIYSAPFRLSFR